MPTGPFWLTLRQIVLRSGPPGGRLLTVPEAGDPPVPVPRAWIESDAECKLSLPRRERLLHDSKTALRLPLTNIRQQGPLKPWRLGHPSLTTYLLRNNYRP